MEEDDEIQAQACKFPRLGNGRNEPNKLGSTRGNDAEDGEVRKRVGSDGSTNRFHSTSTWHQSSRIVRVSRASGGKDRHSKVTTSKGLRDRRVRLSVNTAIQFYDLQDRLGYDQPSKAVEWLIKAASDAISELPPLNYTSFPDSPKQPSDEKRPSALVTDHHQQGFVDEVDGDNTNNNNYHYQNQNQNQNQSQSQNFSLSNKSACSSTSETSKGSGLSLSRSEIRVKARERARERTAKEREKENESHIAHHHHHPQTVNPMSQAASFTELLTGGIGSTTVSLPTTTTSSPNGSVHRIHGGCDEPNLFNKATTTTRQSQQWSSTVTPMVMDYFSSGLVMGPSSSRTHQSSSSTGFSGQIQLGNSSLPVSVSPFSAAQNHSDQLHQFSFIPAEHLIASGSDCNLNFTISPSLAGYNRGTLQSNSPSHILPHHHLQRFSSPLDGSNNLPFFIGGGASTHPASAAPTMDANHHQLQFSPVFDGRLQLCYGDGTRHSDQKGKAKN